MMYEHDLLLLSSNISLHPHPQEVFI